MQSIETLRLSIDAPRGCVLTIGNFDGVHLGHQRILSVARENAGAYAAPVVVLTFEPHPATLLSPARLVERLTTPAERSAWLRHHGADEVCILRVDGALLGLSAEEFLQQIVARLHPRAIVEGPDFNFGKGRGGSIETLRDFGRSHDVAVVIAPEVHGENLPERPAVHSNAIRAALRAGDVTSAAGLLGRPYRIVGVVGVGHGRGAALGMPTANLDHVPHLVPGHGVYACMAQLPSGARHTAAVNIGPQPTFDQMTARVEAHLLDFAADLRGQSLGLHFFQKLRAPQKFPSAAALVAQVQADCDAVRALDIPPTETWSAQIALEPTA